MKVTARQIINRRAANGLALVRRAQIAKRLDTDGFGLLGKIEGALAVTTSDEVCLHIRKRIEAVRLAESSPLARQAECEKAAADVAYWVNQWVWTYDPREAQPMLPFILFLRQENLLHWLEDRERADEDGIVEKSRDSGLTWLGAAFLLHRWLFKDGFKGSIGSRKENLVDKLGDPDSIFEKIRIILRWLPEWMMPKGFKWSEHDNFCKLINPANGSTLTGEAGDNMGRGGRASIYLIDESAFIERPQKVDAALSATSRCKIHISTPNGQGNPFHAKRSSGKYPVFTFHWRDDPRKGDAWYQTQKEALDPVTLAQEVDIDYAASVEGIAVPAIWVRAAVGLDLPASDFILAGLDVAAEGKNRNVLAFRAGAVLSKILSWAKGNTHETAYKAADITEQVGGRVLAYDCVGVGAGIQGTLDSGGRELLFSTNPINGGQSPTSTRWPDGKTSKEKFINYRAELYWLVRIRFEKTYEYVELGIEHPLDELISLPSGSDADVQKLIAQLSMPLFFRTEAGKIKIESKLDMSRRGIQSPDHADAFIYTFAEPPENSESAYAPHDNAPMASYTPR